MVKVIKNIAYLLMISTATLNFCSGLLKKCATNKYLTKEFSFYKKQYQINEEKIESTKKTIALIKQELKDPEINEQIAAELHSDIQKNENLLKYLELSKINLGIMETLELTKLELTNKKRNTIVDTSVEKMFNLYQQTIANCLQQIKNLELPLPLHPELIAHIKKIERENIITQQRDIKTFKESLKKLEDKINTKIETQQANSIKIQEKNSSRERLQEKLKAKRKEQEIEALKKAKERNRNESLKAEATIAEKGPGLTQNPNKDDQLEAKLKQEEENRKKALLEASISALNTQAAHEKMLHKIATPNNTPANHTEQDVKRKAEPSTPNKSALNEPIPASSSFNIKTSQSFDTWFREQDPQAQSIIQERLERLQVKDFGDVRKINEQEKIWEIRIKSTNPELRVYYEIAGNEIIILCAGTKAQQKKMLSLLKKTTRHDEPQ